MKQPCRRPTRIVFLVPAMILAVLGFGNLTGLVVGHAYAPGEPDMLNPGTVLSASVVLPTSGDPKIDNLIANAGAKYGVDPKLIHAIVWQESRYKPAAHSHAGADGLMQLMPDTAKRFGCTDSSDPEKNIDAGTHYVRWLLHRFDGDLNLVLAGYNAGEGAVDKFSGIPPYHETEDYVKNIVSRYGSDYHPVPDAPIEDNQERSETK